jgi:hypothetical protein
MTIVREEENGNNGHHAGGVWRGGRCPSSRDTRAGALTRFGRIDRSVERSPCALRSDRPKHRRSSLRASVSSDRRAQPPARQPIRLPSLWQASFKPGVPAAAHCDDPALLHEAGSVGLGRVPARDSDRRDEAFPRGRRDPVATPAQWPRCVPTSPCATACAESPQ